MLLLGSKYVPVKYYGGDLMEEKISSGRLHRLVLSDRHSGSVTGVNDVVSFD